MLGVEEVAGQSSWNSVQYQSILKTCTIPSILKTCTTHYSQGPSSLVLIQHWLADVALYTHKLTSLCVWILLICHPFLSLLCCVSAPLKLVAEYHWRRSVLEQMRQWLLRHDRKGRLHWPTLVLYSKCVLLHAKSQSSYSGRIRPGFILLAQRPAPLGYEFD